MVILDTNIIIDHLRRPSVNTIFSRLPQLYPAQTFAISIISVQELYTGKSTRGNQEKEVLLMIISKIEIFPYTYEIAKVAGQIQRDLDISVGFADAAIAATALARGAQLATLNPKDFRNIPGLNLIQLS